jgi:hypothetical protein
MTAGGKKPKGGLALTVPLRRGPSPEELRELQWFMSELRSARELLPSRRALTPALRMRKRTCCRITLFSARLSETPLTVAMVCRIPTVYTWPY